MNLRAFLRRLFALTRKEFQQMKRDRGSILLGVVLPLALILIIGYGLSLDVKNVRTAVALEDSSPTPRSAFLTAATISPLLTFTQNRKRKR